MPKKPASPSTASALPSSPTATRRRTPDVASEASDRSPVTQTTVTTSEEVLARASDIGADLSAQPTYAEIAQAAYERYLQRGQSDGRDLDDWIEAERELRDRAR